MEKARIDHVFENKEIQSLITAIGCGIGEDNFNEEKLRYHRIVIMTDADVDGSHIATLLLTFFFRQMKPLIEKGYVYLAKSPLYKVTKKKNERYIDSDEQLDRYLIELGCEDIRVKRIASGETLDLNEVRKITQFVAKSQQITQGLHRHGVNPDYYLTLGKDGKFPFEMITVHETDGSLTEKLVYTKEEEEAVIADAEKRLPPVELSTENAAGGTAEDGTPPPPKPLHPAIDIIALYESKACEEQAQQIIEAGYDPKTVFSGEEPLFSICEVRTVKREDGTETVEETGDAKNVNSMKELFETIKSNGREGLKIQRYKGLGEMNPEQLWETTMDPQRRKMIRVSMEDAVQAERMFTLLMGDDVEPRREYIERHAAGVKDLDI